MNKELKETFDRIADHIDFENCDDYIKSKQYIKDMETIKSALERLENLEKALKILKKYIPYELDEDLHDLVIDNCGYHIDEKEEYKDLKKVLEEK